VAPVSRRGTFSVPGLPAGNYLMVLVSDGVREDWQDAASLEALEKKAARVTLADGDRKTVEIRR
jgi:hypothetical protein